MGRRRSNSLGLDPNDPRGSLRRRRFLLDRLLPPPFLHLATKFLATKSTKVFTELFWCRLCFLCLFVANMLSSVPQPHARVAQWIRALASGARGRRFDPCRG